jgi:hypothetical protein
LFFWRCRFLLGKPTPAGRVADSGCEKDLPGRVLCALASALGFAPFSCALASAPAEHSSLDRFLDVSLWWRRALLLRPPCRGLVTGGLSIHGLFMRGLDRPSLRHLGRPAPLLRGL